MFRRTWSITILGAYLSVTKCRNDPDRNIPYISHKWHSAMQFLYNTLANYRFAEVKRRF